MGSSGHSQPFNGNSLLSVSQEASAPAWSQVPSDGGDVTGHIGRASYTGQSEIYLQEKRNAWGGGGWKRVLVLQNEISNLSFNPQLVKMNSSQGEEQVNELLCSYGSCLIMGE